MMKKRLVLLFCGLFLTAALRGEEPSAPLLRNRLLKEELALAREPALYFIISLKARTLALKSRGLILQEWRIESVHRWGDAPPLQSLVLEKKSTLYPPKRREINPAAESAASTFELEALELKDMPSKFVLYLDRGVAVYFRPKPRNFLSHLGNVGHLVFWNLWLPLKNLSSKLKKKPLVAIDLGLAGKEDVQAMYWALPDGVKGLIFPL
jgi:hypothetical protein